LGKCAYNAVVDSAEANVIVLARCNK